MNVARDNFGPIVFGAQPLRAPSLHQLPPPVGDFTGRGADVAKLEAMTQHMGYSPVIINLYGPPGVGKSALALHVAHRLAARFSDAQLYVDAGEASSQLGEREILAHFVTSLALADSNPAMPVHELRARYLSVLNDSQCLVLIDNVQDERQVRGLIPNSSQAVLLVTSRAPLATLEAAHLYRVEVLTDAESIDLLTTVTGRASLADTVPAQRRIVKACGRLPLAVRIAGAIAKKRPRLSVERLAAQLGDEHHRLQLLQLGHLDVRGSFMLSYRFLTPAARAAFRVSSLSPTADFRIEDLATMLAQEVLAVSPSVDELVDVQLMETTDGVTLRCHDLIALFATELSKDEDGEESRAVAYHRLIQALVTEFTEDYHRAWRRKQWQFSEWIESWAFNRADVDPDAVYIEQRLAPVTCPEQGLNWAQAITRTPRMLIFGAPGSGKTTLAERICFEVNGRRSSPFGLAFSVPLRQYTGDSSLEPLIASWVQHQSDLRFSSPVLEAILADEQVLVVFDSIDELPQSIRNQCKAAIELFCTDHPNIAVVVTSRPDRQLQRTGILGFTEHTLCDLTDTETEHFIRTWLGNDLAFALLMQSAPLPPFSFMRNPLLLTWMMATYQRQGQLPVREAELHQAVFDMTVGSRDRYRYVQRSELNYGTAVECICFLAYWMKSSPDRVTGAAEHQLVEALTTRALVTRLRHAEALLTFLVDQMRLLYPSGIDSHGTRVLSIVQDSFGEFLAARWITRESYSDGFSIDEFVLDVITLIAGGRFDFGWRYAIDLLAKEDDAHKARLVTMLRIAAADYHGPNRDHVIQVLSG